MPIEIYDRDEFVRISERAIRCTIKRLGDHVKIKLKTKRRLYTIKVKAEEAEELISRLKIKCTEL